MKQSNFASIEYKYGQERQTIIIDEKNNSELSPISMSILDSVFSNQVTIIFSQGPLNLSPIISSLFAFVEQKDIFVGIPKKQYTQNHSKNTQTFFSLLYRKKFNSTNSRSNSLYFYEKMLWCKGHINEETNEMIGIEVSTRPKYGTRRYRNDYDSNINEKLENGKFQTIPKIVSIPVSDISPSSIIGEKPIQFKNEKYKLKKFDPKLIIYESINNRKYNFDNILNLIESSYDSDVKLVLHFSWPYLKNLSYFLEKTKEYKNLNVLHLGKRFCIDLKDAFERPSPSVRGLSLEGNLWDTYYPVDTSFNYQIVMPKYNLNNQYPNIKEIINYDCIFDTKIEELREFSKHENINRFEKNILQFPPIIDSFLPPSDIKKFTTKYGRPLSLPIQDTFSIETEKNSFSVNLFKGLCFDLEKSRDIAYEIRNLFTTKAVSKNTLLQACLIEKMNQFYDVNEQTHASIVIANLHPYYGTQKSFRERIGYFVNSIGKILGNLPYLIFQDNDVYMEFELPNGKKHREMVYRNGDLKASNIRNVKKVFNQQFESLFFNVDSSSGNLSIVATEPVQYFQYGKSDDKAKTKKYNELKIYECAISEVGSFDEKKISNISFGNNIDIKITIKTINKKNQISIDHTIEMYYADISKMSELPREVIQRSELFIPGPIPFHTISDQELLISHGYDSLLLPFKKITFFVYPGYNFWLLLKQIKIYKDLISDDKSNVAKKDLSISLSNTKKNRYLDLPSNPKFEQTDEDEINGDTPLDNTIRKELIDTEKAEDYEINEIKTLQDIWKSIKERTQPKSTFKSFASQSLKEQIEFCVEYYSGKRETILFPVGTLIRKKVGDKYDLCSVEELSMNDEIYYISDVELGSIENYLLINLLSEDELSLEDILEPLVDFKIFYDYLRKIDIKKYNPKKQMEKIHWLSSEQKKILYDVLYTLLNENSSVIENDRRDIISDSIWNDIDTNKLIEIFAEGNNKVTKSKLYKVAIELGLKSYAEGSFKALCSKSINEQKHYYFHEEENLLVLGKLLGNPYIIENYQLINEKGSKVGNFLRQIGFSLKRISSGNSDPLNEIDMLLINKLKKCTVVRIGKC